ncbi:hypothetical protein CWB41_00020 [Methylovirgula ligni]|uniref:hypothetical protein n=1 Tax=Methylovirgula ligni TaxID=569860 RepID=UPI000E27541E|nr:hypothetical protein [Methylovirgula ligni]QAY94323.1 hypothetical protein CWB41_00020 [Methylovirgula ligni]
MAVAAALGATLALSLVLASAVTPAAAQWWLPPWANPNYRGDYPPDDRGDYSEPRGVSVVDVRRHVAKLGLHLVAKPRKKDEIYLAEASDPSGTLHRLVFDAESGHLIQNTPLPPRKKKIAAAKPVPVAAPAAVPAPTAVPAHAPDEAAGH